MFKSKAYSQIVMFNYQMLRQKTIVTRQRRNSNQIVNVQTRELSLIDKEETLAKYQMYKQKLLSIDKEETLAKQQTYREKSDRQTDRPANTQ